MTAEEDLNEKLTESVKKRLPWLIILLFLGMVVSSVVGAFESVVAVIPIVMCFQSLILDMAGNVGTQSLAVTIRVLMDEELTAKQISYYKDKTQWTKNMVCRIIENEHYCGDEEYPRIVDRETFDKAVKQKAEKGGVREKDTEEIAYLKTTTVCETCGIVIRR